MSSPTIFIIIRYYSRANMMILTSRNQPRKYHRVLSAKISKNKSHSEEKQKPGGNRTSQINNYEKKQVNNLLYKTAKNNLLSLNATEKRKTKRSLIPSTYREIEELFEENTALKKQNNKLNEELAHIKSRIDTRNRKQVQQLKQYDIQFQKQLYWNMGNKSYMISGIKYQYEKLKKRFEEQEEQMMKIKKQIRENKIQEYRILVEILEKENKRLVDLVKKKQDRGLGKMGQSNYQEKCFKMQKMNEELTIIIHQTKQQLQQKQAKTLFLQKLLIQKDNQDYHNLRKIKKLEKSIQQLKQTNMKFNEQIAILNKINENEKIKLRTRMQEQKQQIKLNMKKIINELQNKLEFVLEEKKLVENNLMKIKRAGTTIRRNTVGGNIISNTNSLHNICKLDHSFQQQNHKIQKKHNIDIPESQSVHGCQSLEEEEEYKRKRMEKNKNRVMLTSKKKHSEEAKKLRKVQFQQILEIAQLIKYRLMSQGISSEELKKYFDKNSSVQPISKIQQSEIWKSVEKDSEWQDQHITMREVKGILMAHPFNLQEPLAHLLARYAIEDGDEQYVYCHDTNENKRQIVKSIIKAVVGNYTLPTQHQQQQFQDFKLRYLSNFYSALKTYYPNGKISKKKFIEVLIGMGTKISQECLDYLLAKILGKSHCGLNQMKYHALSQM